MIAHLKGILANKSNDHVIVNVGGVGYQVHLSQNSLKELPDHNQDISLHIYTHVREDQLTLFGFTSQEEKTIFQRLMDVSGIGPKLALTILSGMAPSDIVHAVIKEDMVRLHAIQGIGKKTAERIIVDLKDKFLKEFAGVGVNAPIASKPLYNDAMSALLNLGYPRATVENVLANVSTQNIATVQGIVKQALRELGTKN